LVKQLNYQLQIVIVLDLRNFNYSNYITAHLCPVHDTIRHMTVGRPFESV